MLRWSVRALCVVLALTAMALSVWHERRRVRRILDGPHGPRRPLLPIRGAA